MISLPFQSTVASCATSQKARLSTKPTPKLGPSISCGYTDRSWTRFPANGHFFQLAPAANTCLEASREVCRQPLGDDLIRLFDDVSLSQAKGAFSPGPKLSGGYAPTGDPAGQSRRGPVPTSCSTTLLLLSLHGLVSVLWVHAAIGREEHSVVGLAERTRSAASVA